MLFVLEYAGMSKPLIAINCTYEGELGAVIRRESTILMPYVEAVLQAGGLPFLVPAGIAEGEVHEYAERADGFLFTGGHDYDPALYGQNSAGIGTLQTKERTETDVALMKLALASTKPLLGICAGMQLANIVSGGELIQHLETAKMHESIDLEHDSTHLVTLQDGARLREIFGTELLRVNSAHHQAVDPDNIGDGLKISAVAEDGVIEGLELAESNGRFFELVQWHPERIAHEEHQRKFFSAFIAACSK